MVEAFIYIVVGFIIGRLLTDKPFIEITIKNKQEAPSEYNESLVDELDPEIRSYYDNTHGLNKF